MVSSAHIPSSGQLRVLYIGLKNDYGDPRRGSSFEHLNLFMSLAGMKNMRAELFPFDEMLRAAGRKKMNRLLLEKVSEVQPQLCFFVLFTDEIDKRTIQQISESGTVRTINWFCDDHWRFDNFSKFYAPYFHWVVTTDKGSVEKYKKMGCQQVIRSQWACNHFLYRPQKSATAHAVTFVGRAHSTRRKVLGQLAARGLDVECWGRGWNRGRVGDDDMLSVFSGSKVNLNFAESSVVAGWKPFVKIFLKRRADGSLRMNSLPEMLGSLSFGRQGARSQIKGRNFEIPGTGGFLLTQYVDGLEEYYRLDEEVVVFRSVDELVEKAKYYLMHDAEREAIRSAGYARTIQEHTYEQRFNQIFRTIGLIT